ncbi:rhodanese-like domain-containing protein [Bacillus andreraoultii]|uniref:rhodanese-like domain-containing protein n=1 Tax=Bacillus andreraoultii TaxID=1499685 RepID=UPI0009E3C816|nr:rhodanese-like domain-containing protein [Bacillus andreraoultii]
MKTITPKEIEERLEKGEELHIIDVREVEEVAEGMIPSAKHIPMMQIPDRLKDLDQHTEYIFVCRSGNRSGQVCSFLEGQGYIAINMVGGMLEWTGELEWNEQNS